jgi:putative aminopeptidase FrvX
MKKKEFIKEYLNAYTPVSEEMEGQRIWAKYIKPYVDEIQEDFYGSLIAKVKGKKRNNYKVVIEAHCDEISWRITKIEGNGLIKVTKNGGSDSQIAPSKRGIIHTRSGRRIEGVFGSKPIHVKDGKDASPKPEDLYFDVGLDSKKRVNDDGIEVGNIITFNDMYTEIGDYYCGRSLDDKIGGIAIAEVARIIKEEKIILPFDLYIVNSVQEEVGMIGGKMTAERIKPNAAICTDVYFETNVPGMNQAKWGDIKAGKGGIIDHTSQLHRNMIELLRSTAEKNDIPHQLNVGARGNNSTPYHMANGGTPTGCISIPLKYMHTTVEMVHKDDLESTIELFLKTLKKIKGDDSQFKYGIIA